MNSPIRLSKCPPMTTLCRLGPGRRNGRNGAIAVTVVPTPIQPPARRNRQHLITKKVTQRSLRKKRFPAKDLKAKSVEGILLIGIKTIEKIDPLPVIRHLKFLAEKSMKKMFEPIAFVKYDEAVRDRVNNKGPSQFGIIETDEVYSHFSLENMVKVTGGLYCQQGGDPLYKIRVQGKV